VTSALLLLALARSAEAQSPMPFSGEAPAASTAPAVSTATAVAASTDTLANVVTSTGGVKVGGGAPKAKLSRPMHAVIHAEAKDWEPLAVKAGGDPFQAETRTTLRQEKVRGKYKGTPMKVAASARLYKAGQDRWLVIRVFPKGLVGKRRLHFEVRLKIFEGFVEEAKAAVVTVVDPRAEAGDGLDSYELRDRGVEFEEDSPASGTLLISALDPRPSKSAVNSGALKLAAFGNNAAGLADVSWSVKGLPPPK
jgi:hypothetical protein